MNLSKISLGTAQLGLDYGISNREGKLDRNSALNILSYCWKRGINSYDTAPTYGNSEKIIGTFISSLNEFEKQKIIISSKLTEIRRDIKLSRNKLYKLIKNVKEAEIC